MKFSRDNCFQHMLEWFWLCYIYTIVNADKIFLDLIGIFLFYSPVACMLQFVFMCLLFNQCIKLQSWCVWLLFAASWRYSSLGWNVRMQLWQVIAFGNSKFWLMYRNLLVPVDFSNSYCNQVSLSETQNSLNVCFIEHPYWVMYHCSPCDNCSFQFFCNCWPFRWWCSCTLQVTLVTLRGCCATRARRQSWSRLIELFIVNDFWLVFQFVLRSSHIRLGSILTAVLMHFAHII